MLTAFQKLKPWFMTRLREWNTCRYHTEIKDLLLGFNNMRTICRGVHVSCHCDYAICHQVQSFHENEVRCEARDCRYSDVTAL